MMRLFIYVFSVTTLLVSLSWQKSTPASPDYVAGVVEMDPMWNLRNDPVLKTVTSMQEFLKIINSNETTDIDIIIFPESTLNTLDTAEYVPEPDDRVAPCDDNKFDMIMRNISCAARNKSMYIVINLTEKSNCPNRAMTSQNDTRPCASNQLNKYNANVVFDRNGTVISRYRKYNLFGEDGINTTLIADHSTFTTDFGVTFGHFICFDLMFKVPAQNLLHEYGIKDVIFPTMWFSELPFLTAAQIQQNWAYENNVNLLAAGASNAMVGSTGTGIYSGKLGPLASVMSPRNIKQLYVARIPKMNTNRPATIVRNHTQFPPVEMDDVYLKRDQLDVYATKQLNNGPVQMETLCHNDLCCTFNINVTRKTTTNNNYYRYRIAVYEGTRTFDGFADGEVIVCGIIACTDDTLLSCGTRFNKTTTYDQVYNFTHLSITGNFNMQEAFILPNAVDTSIMPIDIDDFKYVEGPVTTVNNANMREIKMELAKTHDDLLSFAIYGRRWVKLNGSERNYVNWVVLLMSLIFAKLLL